MRCQPLGIYYRFLDKRGGFVASSFPIFVLIALVYLFKVSDTVLSYCRPRLESPPKTNGSSTDADDRSLPSAIAIADVRIFAMKRRLSAGLWACLDAPFACKNGVGGVLVMRGNMRDLKLVCVIPEWTVGSLDVPDGSEPSSLSELRSLLQL